MPEKNEVYIRLKNEVESLGAITVEQKVKFILSLVRSTTNPEEIAMRKGQTVSVPCWKLGALLFSNQAAVRLLEGNADQAEAEVLWVYRIVKHNLPDADFQSAAA